MERPDAATLSAYFMFVAPTSSADDTRCAIASREAIATAQVMRTAARRTSALFR